jgi:geranylgeranyl diphosphate synthase type II
VDVAADRRLAELGARLGLMFQIADDILDVEGSAGALGKTVGKDARAAKLTYPGLYGLEESKRRLAGVRDEALELAASLPRGGGHFPAFIDYLARRDH